MTKLELMQTKAATVGAAREELASMIKVLNAAHQTANEQYMPYIKKLARKAIKSEAELVNLIKASPEMFAKPRTQLVDGIRFGLQKQKGKLTWEHDGVLCGSIRKMAEKGLIEEGLTAALIKTTEKPVAAALNSLDAAMLKKLGVTVTADTDAVVIKNEDDVIEKSINALFKESQDLLLDDSEDEA